MTPESDSPGHKPGSLVRQTTAVSVDLSIDSTKTEIRAALNSGNLELALVLISRHAGLRLIRGMV
jgi:hypothetical protein